MSSRSGFLRATRRSLWSLALLAPLPISHAAAQTPAKPVRPAATNPARPAAAAETQAVVAPALAAIAGSVPAGVARAAKLGPLNANQTLSILVCFDFADPQAAQDYANAVSDPNNLLYRQWLTPQEVGQKFGPVPDDYTTMLNHLQAQGLTVEEMPVNRLTLRVRGTAAQVQQAFGVTLSQYRESAADARAKRGASAVPYDFYAPDAPVQIPGSLAGKITSVEGLENYTRPIFRSKKARAKTQSSLFDALQARVGYNISPIYDALNATTNNKPGTGRTVGISNFDGVDVATNGPLFITRNALPFPAAGKVSNISTVVVGTPNGTSGGAEGDLDFQMVLGQSPLATIIIYDSTNDLVGVLAKEASDNKADVLTESYGWNPSAATITSAHNQHTTMTTQGQTYLVASGDTGNINNNAYEYSDYEPDELLIGGTILTVGAGNVFSSEAGWNGSTGGAPNAPAAFNVLQSWLKGRGVPTTPNKRLIPDISSHSSGPGGAGAYNIYYGGSLIPGGISGTSCASPVDAGDFAVLEQYLISQNALPAKNGKQRLGRINDALYGFNGRNDIFHDTTGSVNNGAGTTTKYWDYVTGWGSVNWNNLAAALIAPLSVSVTPGSASLAAGKTAQLTATVAGSNVKTVTWSVASGPGTVSATGLYTAPFTVTSTQTVIVKATSTLDTANPGVTTVATVQPSPVFGQATITLTAVPNSVTISGVVTLEGVSDPAFTVITTNPVTFVLTPAGGAATTVTQPLGPGGSFSIGSLPAANYTVTIEGDKWLRAKTNVNASAGDVTNVAVTLLAGDSNGDNSIDPTDFSVFVSAYNSDISIIGSSYDPLADFNNDGLVDANDFSLFVSNYNKVGQ